jgi:hypothetical protein
MIIMELFFLLYMFIQFRKIKYIHMKHSYKAYTIQSPQSFFIVIQRAIISTILAGMALEIATVY